MKKPTNSYNAIIGSSHHTSWKIESDRMLYVKWTIIYESSSYFSNNQANLLVFYIPRLKINMTQLCGSFTPNCNRDVIYRNKTCSVFMLTRRGVDSFHIYIINQNIIESFSITNRKFINLCHMYYRNSRVE